MDISPDPHEYFAGRGDFSANEVRPIDFLHSNKLGLAACEAIGITDTSKITDVEIKSQSHKLAMVTVTYLMEHDFFEKVGRILQRDRMPQDKARA